MRLSSIRLALFGLAIALGARATAQSPAVTSIGKPTRVVFVCEHGSVKSLVAALYFNRRAEERGLPYRAMARGTAPESAAPATVRDGLQADGFAVSGFAPRLLEASDVEDATLVVSFDQDITKTVGGKAPYLRWDDLPGVLADYGRGRDAIVIRIDTLISALERGSR